MKANRNTREVRVSRTEAIEQSILEFAKESRVDGGYSRKVNGKQRDRMKAERSKSNRRKSSRN